MDQPGWYTIVVAGSLDPAWSPLFADLQIEVRRVAGDTPLTILRGELPDQSALLGVLQAIRDLNLCLVRLERTPLEE